MSYANGTTHYNLPQTVGTDKRDWFDTNAAFAALDAALYAAATGQASDAEAIASIQQILNGQASDITGLQTLTGQHTSQIAALNTTVNNLGAEVSDVRQDAEDMITANNEGAAATSTKAYAIGDYFIYNDVMYKATSAIAVGDTIVPNTNCVATNVDTELDQLNSDLAEIEPIGTIYTDDETKDYGATEQWHSGSHTLQLPAGKYLVTLEANSNDGSSVVNDIGSGINSGEYLSGNVYTYLAVFDTIGVISVKFYGKGNVSTRIIAVRVK